VGRISRLLENTPAQLLEEDFWVVLLEASLVLLSSQSQVEEVLGLGLVSAEKDSTQTGHIRRQKSI
jgi:hypothetical protein